MPQIINGWDIDSSEADIERCHELYKLIDSHIPTKNYSTRVQRILLDEFNINESLDRIRRARKMINKTAHIWEALFILCQRTKPHLFETINTGLVK